MDPLRRLLLLGLVASVILTEPAMSRASMAMLAQRAEAHDATAAIAEQLVQRLSVVLEHEEEATRAADAARRIAASAPTESTRPAREAQVGFVHAILSPHEFRPPPPVVEG